MKTILSRRHWAKPEHSTSLVVVAVMVTCLIVATAYIAIYTPAVENVPVVTPPSVDDRPVGINGLNSALRPQTSKNKDATEEEYMKLRTGMVEDQIAARGVTDPRVLDAMRSVPRHKFVPDNMRNQAYRDSALPIGHAQTISQPLIVAMMTELARPAAKSKALDVGTGSGYQAAILGELAEKVYSIEILKPLAQAARDRLKSMGYDNIEVRCGDGYRGWPEHAPFDVIIVAAAPDHVPQPLIDQLALGGHLVIPVGNRLMQSLLVIEKQADGTIQRRTVTAVSFVPMTGEALKD